MLMIMTAQVERHAELKALVEEFGMPIVRMEHNLQLLIDGLEGMLAWIVELRTAFVDIIYLDVKRHKICTWLSDIPYTRYHRTAATSRREGTCQWLLQTAKF